MMARELEVKNAMMKMTQLSLVGLCLALSLSVQASGEVEQAIQAAKAAYAKANSVQGA